MKQLAREALRKAVRDGLDLLLPAASTLLFFVLPKLWPAASHQAESLNNALMAIVDALTVLTIIAAFFFWWTLRFFPATMPRRAPRFPRTVLYLCLSHKDMHMADELEETFKRVIKNRRLGSIAVRLWYWRQAFGILAHRIPMRVLRWAAAGWLVDWIRHLK